MCYSSIECCRICYSKNLRLIYDLGDFYSCGYFQATKPDFNAPVAPLCIIVCSSCGLVQLKHNYDQDDLFRNTYGYRSSLNKSMSTHLETIVNSIFQRISLSAEDCVLDIGSNDATLLKSYKIPGLLRIGIDPSIDQFLEFYPSDIKTQADFFSAEVYNNVLGDIKAKVITSISMLYDLPNPNDFVSDISKVLHSDGLWVFEQSYLPLMILRNSFDTICHEHLEYYSLHQIIDLLEKHHMRVLDVEFNDVNGGSFRVYACHLQAKFISNLEKINGILFNERNIRYNIMQVFDDFWKRINNIKISLLNFLEKSKKMGKKVHGYGASTKGNTLLQYFGITTDLLELIADCNSTKWNCYTPGTKIPIVSEKISRVMQPDYYLVLPWHFRDNFLLREKQFIDSGGNFIFPLPEFEICGVSHQCTISA